MPRRKVKHTANVKFTFSDEETFNVSTGELMVRRIEQAALFLTIARESGDVACIESAKALRMSAVKQIDEWAGQSFNRQIKGAKGPVTRNRDKQKGNGPPLKKVNALAEIKRLVKEGKELHAIPGIVEKKGICSARYARDLMKEIGN